MNRIYGIRNTLLSKGVIKNKNKNQRYKIATTHTHSHNGKRNTKPNQTNRIESNRIKSNQSIKSKIYVVFNRSFGVVFYRVHTFIHRDRNGNCIANSFLSFQWEKKSVLLITTLLHLVNTHTHRVCFFFGLVNCYLCVHRNSFIDCAAANSDDWVCAFFFLLIITSLEWEKNCQSKAK